jgi:uncharacterized protein DUF6916
MPDGAPLTLETFSPALGEAFAIDLGEAGTLELRLVEAEARPGSLNAPRRPFALLFRGPAQPLLPQGTYAFEQATIGPLAIFVVPIAQDDEGTSYEAIFA